MVEKSTLVRLAIICGLAAVLYVWLPDESRELWPEALRGFHRKQLTSSFLFPGFLSIPAGWVPMKRPVRTILIAVTGAFLGGAIAFRWNLDFPELWVASGGYGGPPYAWESAGIMFSSIVFVPLGALLGLVASLIGGAGR